MKLSALFKPAVYRRYWETMIAAPRANARARRDMPELIARMPSFSRYRTDYKRVAAELAPIHREYIHSVSNETMAASLRLGAFLDILIAANQFTRVADLGSGFTSFVLRRIGRKHRPPLDIWSVDDNPAWLAKTGAYLRKRGLDGNQLVTWEDFKPGEQAGRFDLVVHDMGWMSVRERTLEQVLDLVKPGGYVVLDDVQKPGYRRAAEHILAERGLRFWSLKALTTDRYGRYAYLVVV